ncbi:MAG: hypothetical protein AAF081_07055 [Actinomycetota bacterium]
MPTAPILFTAALGLALVTTACSSEDLAENLVEQAVENETGGDVDLDFDSDGDGSFTVETDEGSVTYGTGGDLPAGFPASFDVLDGMTVVFSGETSDDVSTAATAILEGDLSPNEVVDHYTALAIAEGYTLDRELETELDVVSNMSNGATSLNIIGGSNGTNTSVSITFETNNG